MSEFQGRAETIDREDAGPYIEAAEDLGCELAAIQAVAEVESRGAPFLSAPDNRPKILYERHIFSRLTGRRFDGNHAEVSNRKPGGYEGGAAEYPRLEQAIALDRQAALKSASWGKFQIMGFNCKTCGFQDVEDFVEAMCDSEEAHLQAFVGFVQANKLDRALRARDWRAFAKGYNGPNFAKNKYDTKMASAYKKYAGQGATGFRVNTVRDLQAALNFLGADAGLVDGLMGPKTRNAIRKFQRKTRLPETGEPTIALMQALQAVYFSLGGGDHLMTGA